MLNTLRKIEWPDKLEPVGGIIKAGLIGQVADYDSLISQAHKKAEEITKEAEKRIIKEIETVRQNTSKELNTDFTKFKKVLVKHRDQLLTQSTDLCFEVTKAALGTYVESVEEQRKLKEMVATLIDKLHTNKNLIFQAHPNQVSLVEAVIEENFSNLIKKGDYIVNEDNTLELNQLRVSGVEDAFIDVSINNLLLIINNEIELLKEQFGTELKKGVSFKAGEVDINEKVPEEPAVLMEAQSELDVELEEGLNEKPALSKEAQAELEVELEEEQNFVPRRRRSARSVSNSKNEL